MPSPRAMSESHSERSITSTETSIVRAAGDVYPSPEEPEVDGDGSSEPFERPARAWHEGDASGTAASFASRAEFACVGRHRYHGAAIVEIDDEHDWEAYLSGVPSALDSP